MHTISSTLRIPQPNNKTKEVAVFLDFAGEATKANFLTRAGGTPEYHRLNLEVKSLCIAELVRQYMDVSKQEMYASGEIVSEDADDVEIENLFQTLRGHSGGGMIHHSSYSMLIFPTGQQSWDFLRLPKAGAGIKLQFVVIPPIQALPETAAAQSDSVALQHEQTSTITLDHDRLFHANSRVRNVFLLFHSNHAEEMEALVQSLHTAGSTIYLGSDPGSWAYFATKCDSGTIIVSSVVPDSNYED